ncbi:deoxyribonuclease HsdR [Brochothrix thermosphacta]|uniref:type I restriction endonuclease subunit R n=1 Tax=Brochothrix thermosphacta TaxID=2756 RepID=UPI00083F5B40|nr:HsdR family type I site-specific deoxyribonuclease [Brochothrix thermosphacta]ODJ70816.1 deoxyribonuclease HsdR [Brochothrix thermosphacta]
MSSTPKSAQESTYQAKFVKELQKYKWSAPAALDGTTHRVTVADLIANWREELNRINADQLEGVALTDNEFSQVLAQVNKLNNSYEAAKLLAIEEAKGKIDGIYRDAHPQVTRQQITLTIFKKAEVRGGDSSYKIAREVETTNGNRFDLVLLINGLPLINIEQKRTDISLNEAFGQFKRYYRDGEYTNNFMVFSQMMVLNSEVETRYFATPKELSAFNESFVFHWADAQNKVINHWEQVIAQFLMIPMAHQMVGDYVVIDEAREEENRRHMVMRPYQVSALQKVEAAALGWDTADGQPHGGFVWHTTGSGKTITSFKTALFLATRGGFDKVVFLVDRRELDSRTSANFKAYAAYEPVSVDDTPSTYQLKKQLRAANSGIVVTTTFKLNSLVKELQEAKDSGLANKKIVFIIDEAHRTTMGTMMGTIKNYFREHGLFFGFTGTPLFEENNVTGKINEKSEVIDTTAKLFGPELHRYTIDEAIADKNVLGFHVDYINTGEFSSYDALRDELATKLQEEKPYLSDREIERLVQDVSKEELESAGLFTYQDESHIPRVVSEILTNWNEQSQERYFNAILTVAQIKRVLAYYAEFKKQLVNSDVQLNIAMTFSFGNENEEGPVNAEYVAEMFAEYGQFTGINFIAGDKKRGETSYFEDLVARATRGGSERNAKNIDLVIVADQLLTGYDSKYLNTLYVDRGLESQGLVQAYSRTNRVFGPTKEFGSIVNFQYPALTKEKVNQALSLYGSGGTSSKAIVETYETAVAQLALAIPDLQTALADPTAWQGLLTDEEATETFVEEFKAVAIQLNFVKQYYEFTWDNERFGLTEHVWMQYIGAYKNITEKPGGTEGEDPIMPLVNKSRLVETQQITAGYIIKLIGKQIDETGDRLTVDGETLRIIHEQIQELSDMGEYEQSKLLKEFVDTELVTGQVSSQQHFDEAFDMWKNNRIQAVVYEFADDWGIDRTLLNESVTNYSTQHKDVVPYIDDIIKSLNYLEAKKPTQGGQLMHTMQLTGLLPSWLAEVKGTYH